MGVPRAADGFGNNGGSFVLNCHYPFLHRVQPCSASVLSEVQSLPIPFQYAVRAISLEWVRCPSQATFIDE
jgi:hypothetical protein